MRRDYLAYSAIMQYCSFAFAMTNPSSQLGRLSDYSFAFFSRAVAFASLSTDLTEKGRGPLVVFYEPGRIINMKVKAMFEMVPMCSGEGSTKNGFRVCCISEQS